jgi:hypothetical protein
MLGNIPREPPQREVPILPNREGNDDIWLCSAGSFTMSFWGLTKVPQNYILIYLKQVRVWSFQEKNMLKCYHDNMITLSRYHDNMIML